MLRIGVNAAALDGAELQVVECHDSDVLAGLDDLEGWLGAGKSEVARELTALGVTVVPATLPDALYESLGDVVVAELANDEAAGAVADEIAGLAIPVETFDRLAAALGSVPEIGWDGPTCVVALLGGDEISSGATPGDAIQDALWMIEDGSF